MFAESLHLIILRINQEFMELYFLHVYFSGRRTKCRQEFWYTFSQNLLQNIIHMWTIHILFTFCF